MPNRKPTHRKHHRLHDYKSRCIYHITLVVSDRVPLFGRMVGETVDEARVEHTELGFAISEEIQALPSRCAKKGRQVKILAKVVMPEHIHFVLFVEKPMDVKLQMVLRGFKQGCNKRLRFWLEKAREIYNLFFELIRVAIGTQDILSYPPSAEEWKALYDMAKKQSLVGICFAGVQHLTTHHPS